MRRDPPAPIQKELDINIKFSQEHGALTKAQTALAARLESQKKRLQELEEEFAPEPQTGWKPQCSLKP